MATVKEDTLVSYNQRELVAKKGYLILKRRKMVTILIGTMISDSSFAEACEMTILPKRKQRAIIAIAERCATAGMNISVMFVDQSKMHDYDKVIYLIWILMRDFFRCAGMHRVGLSAEIVSNGDASDVREFLHRVNIAATQTARMR